ncbi:MAG: asparagine--tRNA ligase [bacterium]
MKRVFVKEIMRNSDEWLGKKVKVAGWIRTLRGSKKLGFMELNDGTFFNNIQVVFEENIHGFASLLKLTVGSAVTVEGEVVQSQGGKQSVEIHAKEVTIVGEADSDYPLQKKRHTFEFMRTIAHLRPRSNTFSAVFRIRSLCAQAVHAFFSEKGFVYVHTPVITGSDCEGAGEMFRVSTIDPAQPPLKKDGTVDYSEDFFGKKTGLTVSGQLAVENFCQGFSNVYTFGPTFRAENSNTQRHVSEFWMIEPEIAFANLSDDMDLAEEMIKYIIRDVLEKAPEEMAFFGKFIDRGLLERLKNVRDSDFARISYAEAVEYLQKSGRSFEYAPEWGKDLQTEHEKYLTEELMKRPVFVYDYPRDIKAFYMRDNEDGKTVAAMDLLVPGVGEIIGGSQREERHDVLLEKIKELGLKEEDYWWYLDLRKYGTHPHAGFGLGFGRLIMYLSGMKNHRDVVPFPRTPKHAEF